MEIGSGECQEGSTEAEVQHDTSGEDIEFCPGEFLCTCQPSKLDQLTS